MFAWFDEWIGTTGRIVLAHCGNLRIALWVNGRNLVFSSSGLKRLRSSVTQSFFPKVNVSLISCVNLGRHHFTKPCERRYFNEDLVLIKVSCRSLVPLSFW